MRNRKRGRASRFVPILSRFIQNNALTCYRLGRYIFQRRERDSNSRYPFGVHTLSRRASSATRASLHERECKDRNYFGIPCIPVQFFLPTSLRVPYYSSLIHIPTILIGDLIDDCYSFPPPITSWQYSMTFVVLWVEFGVSNLCFLVLQCANLVFGEGRAGCNQLDRQALRQHPTRDGLLLLRNTFFLALG